MAALDFLLESIGWMFVVKSKWLLVGEAGGERGEFKGEQEFKGAFTTTVNRVFGCLNRESA